VVPAHRILPGIIAEIIRKAPLSPEKVEFAWRSAVGAGINRVTTVTLREDKTLEVEAIDAQWAREVERSSRLILARLEAMLGPDVVSRLSIRAR
jgi:predicted nucleic acid-binding Zn ribbon protein